MLWKSKEHLVCSKSYLCCECCYPHFLLFFVCCCSCSTGSSRHCCCCRLRWCCFVVVLVDHVVVVQSGVVILCVHVFGKLSWFLIWYDTKNGFRTQLLTDLMLQLTIFQQQREAATSCSKALDVGLVLPLHVSNSRRWDIPPSKNCSGWSLLCMAFPVRNYDGFPFEERKWSQVWMVCIGAC